MGPYFSMAKIMYELHDGSNRHIGGKNGLMHFL